MVEAQARSSWQTAVTILDNGSRDGSETLVHEKFSSFEFFKASANRILVSYNDFLPLVSEPVVILLNNDIRVAPDFIDPLTDKFIKDPELFLTAPKVMSFDGERAEAGRSRTGFKWGQFWCDARYPGYEFELEAASETDSSGFGAFSREKFIALGGYDERFYPGIMEDVDLCLRAKKAGYKLCYQPKSVVYHMGQASFKKAFGQTRMETIAYRNNFLFMWKNFSGVSFWFPHLLFLPLRMVWFLIKGNVRLISGFWEAFLMVSFPGKRG